MAYCPSSRIYKLHRIMKLDISYIESELKKRCNLPYVWNRKQNDTWDDATRFIYKTMSWEALLVQIEEQQKEHDFPTQDFFNYAINRWYNFWSAQAVEKIFTDLPGFAPNPNPVEDHYDFRWLGERIDHKTSIFPKGFGENYAFAKAHKTQLIHWFYKHQSTGQRFHLNNRLFIVVHDQNGEHWKLKAEIELIKSIIEPYGKQKTPAVMEVLSLEEGKETMADIIWVNR